MEDPCVKLNSYMTQDEWAHRTQQELREFALDYVRQIVSKAKELSQAHPQAKQINDNRRIYLINEAANHINSRLNLSPTPKFAADCGSSTTATTKQPKSARLMETPMIIDSPDEPYSSTYVEQTSRSHTDQLDGQTSTTSQRQHERYSSRFARSLNLQFLVSCFSTCLPNVVVDNFQRRKQNPSHL